MQQRRVLDDQRVGMHDRLAGTDLAVVDAAEGHHRRARALGTEEREGLGVEAVAEGGDGQKLGGGHDPLAAPQSSHGRRAQRTRAAPPSPSYAGPGVRGRSPPGAGAGDATAETTPQASPTRRATESALLRVAEP